MQRATEHGQGKGDSLSAQHGEKKMQKLMLHTGYRHFLVPVMITKGLAHHTSRNNQPERDQKWENTQNQAEPLAKAIM